MFTVSLMNSVSKGYVINNSNLKIFYLCTVSRKKLTS
jgi:hypothetical protein